MAKALFHKAQRVYVKPVGTWVLIERVVPHWVKGVDEPLRISYDCGLGRLFQAHELVSEQSMQATGREDEDDDLFLEHWHIVRRVNRWRSPDAGQGAGNASGTFPVVATDGAAAGGWRVPASEYDRDPQRVEHQARMITHTPDLLRVARKLSEFASAHPRELPEALRPVAQRCTSILRSVYRLEDEVIEAAE